VTKSTPSSRTIVIIGATSAIAAACAEIYARQQNHLVLVGRSAAKLERLQAHLKVVGAASVQSMQQDLSQIEQHEALIQRLTADAKRLDVVLLAHGTLGDQETASVQPALLADVMRDNAISHMSLLALLTPVMERQGQGTLAVITSVAGDRGRPSNYVYGAAKGALSVFVDGLRGRLFRHGVAVVNIKPGFVSTPMTAHLKQGVLFVQPEVVAHGIVRAIAHGCHTVYLPSFWRYIMLIIRLIPEVVFKRLSL